jgi:putative SOS response-associated peptidase YedK
MTGRPTAAIGVAGGRTDRIACECATDPAASRRLRIGVEHRCVVPFTSFSEFNKAAGGDIWFALDEARPLAAFAGIWTNWTSVRKVKEGETTNDLFGFLTTEPNKEVAAIHPNAMLVILRTAEEIDRWMTAPAADVPSFQKPLSDGSLKIVAKGTKEDGLLGTDG